MSAAPPTTPFVLPVRIYYEDTDAGGIVYYANYLRYLERARSEVLRSLGYHQHALLRSGVAFVVRALTLDYRAPARLDDALTVVTEIASLGRAQIGFTQCVWRDETRLLDATLRVACIDPASGRPIALPRAMHSRFSSLVSPAP